MSYTYSALTPFGGSMWRDASPRFATSFRSPQTRAAAACEALPPASRGAGRPPFRPRAAAAVGVARVRSLIRSRSN